MRGGSVDDTNVGDGDAAEGMPNMTMSTTAGMRPHMLRGREEYVRCHEGA